MPKLKHRPPMRALQLRISETGLDWIDDLARRQKTTRQAVLRSMLRVASQYPAEVITDLGEGG